MPGRSVEPFDEDDIICPGIREPEEERKKDDLTKGRLVRTRAGGNTERAFIQHDEQGMNNTYSTVVGRCMPLAFCPLSPPRRKVQVLGGNW